MLVERKIDIVLDRSLAILNRKGELPRQSTFNLVKIWSGSPCTQFEERRSW